MVKIDDLIYKAKDDTVAEEKGKYYKIYPTEVEIDGKVFNYVTENNHLLTEEDLSKSFKKVPKEQIK